MKNQHYATGRVAFTPATQAVANDTNCNIQAGIHDSCVLGYRLLHPRVDRAGIERHILRDIMESSLGIEIEQAYDLRGEIPVPRLVQLLSDISFYESRVIDPSKAYPRAEAILELTKNRLALSLLIEDAVCSKVRQLIRDELDSITGDDPEPTVGYI